MNTQNKKQSIVLSALLISIASVQSSQAGITKDLSKKMETLLGHTPEVSNVYEVEKQKLENAESTFQPWSGSYWPDINGGIANHYRNHTKLGSTLNFLGRYEIAKGRTNREHHRVDRKVNDWNDEKLNQKLSPAEKYDLLLGDLDFSFTKAVLDEADFRSKYRLTTMREHSGEDSESQGDDNSGFFEDESDNKSYAHFDDLVRYRYWKSKKGSLAYWSGICDGWAPASIYLPRPENSVTVVGALGHVITFYPDDLKALGAYLFARTNTPYFNTMHYQFAGRKCDSKGTPDLDDETGFVKDVRCNDLDAGVFHMALVNRIGKDGMGFIMDVDNNLKINNHPLASYSFTYYNPTTGKEGSLKDSIADIGDVNDAYTIRRNVRTKKLVGIKATVNFMNYIWPEQNRDDVTDDISKDKYTTKNTFGKTVNHFVYDLELDENGNILGGEWGNRSEEDGVVAKYAFQPDFIWMTAPNLLPYSEQSAYATINKNFTYLSESAVQNLNSQERKVYENEKREYEKIQKTIEIEKAKNIANGKPGVVNFNRPFGKTMWAWDGKSPLPADWLSAAKTDLTWNPPVVGEKITLANGQTDVTPTDAKNSVVKSAQPLSHIVYFLFDKARNENQR